MPHRTRVGSDVELGKSRFSKTSSRIGKSPAPPTVGRAQTSSTTKSGASSSMRSGRAAWATFGTLIGSADHGQ